MSIRFDYDFQRTYTTTLENYIGPTDLTGVRNALPELAPDNTNAIWLAPNGSDGNPGTQASPKLTLTGAYAAVTGALKTIHIFRNGYVGDLAFSESVDVTIIILTNIQVEEGETASVTFNSDKSLIVRHTCVINGIEFISGTVSTFGSDLIELDNASSNLTVDNCKFTGAGSGEFALPLGISAGSVAVTAPVLARNCFFYTGRGATIVSTSSSSFKNCLFIANEGTYSGTNEPTGITEAVETKALGVTTILNCYFIGYENAYEIAFVAQPVAPGHVTNFTNALFIDNDYSFATNVNTPTLDRHNLNLDYVLELSRNFMLLTADPSVPANFVIVITNAVDTDTPLKLVNEDDLLENSTLASSRLQYLGKATPDGSSKYFYDSPLVTAGYAEVGLLFQQVDKSAWDISATNPDGIDQAPDGTLWLVDSQKDRAYHLNADGSLITDWLTTAYDAGATRPRGIAYDTSDDTLWIIDSDSDKVYNVTVAGALITSFACTIYDAGVINPNDISYDPLTDTLWVCDGSLRKIYKIQTDGTLISSFSTDLFASPTMQIFGVAYNTVDDTLWASDPVNDTIFHLTTTGTFIESIPTSVFDTSAFGPRGCSMALDEKLYIVDNTTDSFYKISTGLPIPLSPWFEDTALTTATYNKNLTISWPPDSMQVITNHINPVNNTDIRGNLSTGYDSERRQFNFSFGDSIHLSNIQIKALRDLVADNGSKKFYPLGVGGNLFDVTGSSGGTFSNTDNSVAPTDAVSINMIDDHWRGFWITISSNDYYIDSNDDTKLYLVDKLGNGFPSNGAVTFIIPYILINIEKGSYNINQQNFSQFLEGGQWRENTSDAQRYDMTLDALNLDEIEDEVENL